MATSHEPSSLLKPTVKELTSIHGATSLPSSYIIRDPTRAEAESVVMEEIPKIDLFRLRNGDLEERSKIISDIGRACKEWGCFIVENHGITESTKKAIIKEFVGFFNLTEEEKEFYSSKEFFAPICHGTSTNLSAPNILYWRDFLKMSVHPVLNCPPKPVNFRKISEEFAIQTKEICGEIMKAILKSLEVEESLLLDSLDLVSCIQSLVGNFYPPCPKAELAMGLPRHSDPAFVSLIIQNDTSFNGVQVLHDEKWVVVDLNPESFLLLIGDITEIVSNGRYKAGEHRAMVSNESMRMSVISTIMPAMNDALSPAPKLLESLAEPTKFRPITFKEFIELKYLHKDKISVMDLIKL